MKVITVSTTPDAEVVTHEHVDNFHITPEGLLCIQTFPNGADNEPTNVAVYNVMGWLSVDIAEEEGDDVARESGSGQS